MFQQTVPPSNTLPNSEKSSPSHLSTLGIGRSKGESVVTGTKSEVNLRKLSSRSVKSHQDVCFDEQNLQNSSSGKQKQEKPTRKLSLLGRALTNTRKISLGSKNRKVSAPARPTAMDLNDQLSKSYTASPEKSPSRNNSSLLLRKISSAKYKLTKSSMESNSVDKEPAMCKFHTRIMKFRRKMVCNCNAQGPKVFNSVSEMSRSEDVNTFCPKCSKPTQMLASSCTQNAFKQCYMVDKLFNDAVIHESFGARFLGKESLPNSVMRDAKRNTVIKTLMKKFEKGPKDLRAYQNVFLSIEGESFIVTNVMTKETMFAHSLDNLPLWSVGGAKNKLLALVQHHNPPSSRKVSASNPNNGNQAGGHSRDRKVSSTSGDNDKEPPRGNREGAVSTTVKKVSVGESGGGAGGGGGGRERKLGRGSDSQQYSYTVFFFKCDGDAKGVAEALQKCCMNTRKAMRTSATNTPRSSQNHDGQGTHQRVSVHSLHSHSQGQGHKSSTGQMTQGQGHSGLMKRQQVPSITVTDQGTLNRRSMPERTAAKNSDMDLDSHGGMVAESTPNLPRRETNNNNNDIYRTMSHKPTSQSLRNTATQSSLNQISDSGEKSGKVPLRSATFSQSANSIQKRQRTMKEVYEVQYNGYVTATKAEGLDITNSAITQLEEILHNIYLIITPANITMRTTSNENSENLNDQKETQEIVIECKLRYLSFYAIGNDINKLAFICANPDEQIAHRCYVITCNSGAGRIAQSIERACKARINHAKAFSSFGKHGKMFTRGVKNESKNSSEENEVPGEPSKPEPENDNEENML